MPTLRIESRDNPKLKLARRVRDGREKDLIFVEGLRLSEDAMQSSIGISFAIVRDDFGSDARQSDLVQRLENRDIEILTISEKLFSTVSETRSPQGIVMICERPQTDRASFESNLTTGERKIPVVVMMSTVNNPSNLGAVMRAAEAAGAMGVIVSERSADAFSPKALRSSMGSAFRIPVWSDASHDDAIAWARGGRFAVIAATGMGDVTHTSVDWSAKTVVVMGSEAHGLSGDIIERVDSTLRIDMEPQVESLNMAVAAGVILFEARRQVFAREPLN